MVDDRLAGDDDLEKSSYRCPACGHTTKALSAPLCSKCGTEMLED